MAEDHDQRFKTILKEFFAEFLQLFFASLFNRLSLDQVTWLEQELFTDPPAGDKHTVDLLARVPLRDRTNPSTHQLILIHVEIESAESVEPLRRRMFDYWYDLRRKYPGSKIRPIAVYLKVGLNGIGRDLYEETFEDEDQLKFWYDYVGLPGLKGEDYAEMDNPLAVSLSALMRIPKADRVRLALRAIERSVQSNEDVYRKYLLVECVQAYAPLEDEEKIELTDLLDAPGGVRPIMKTLAEQCIDQGREEGIQLANEAADAAFREFLIGGLEEKFGPLSSTMRQRILSIPSHQLAVFGRRAMIANSLDELN